MPLQIVGISKSFGKIQAIKDINLQVNDGEFVCVVGPSGCGKTTLLRIIAGVEKQDEGKIIFDEKEVNGPRVERGMVFQGPALFPWRNVRRNIEFGLEIKGLKNDERKKVSEYYIDLVKLRGFEDAYPYQLSGGMEQRVNLARALANNPKLLLMDEPFGSLDTQTRYILQDEVLEIWKKEKRTILFVTHFVDEAVYLADRLIVLTERPGKIKKAIEIDLPRPREREKDFLSKVR
jgi:NitT/TauT family transport system ATP-binding protein